MPMYRGYFIYKPFGGAGGYKAFGLSGAYKSLPAIKKAINNKIKEEGKVILSRPGGKTRKYRKRK
jgi:hypothetical protein